MRTVSLVFGILLSLASSAFADTFYLSPTGNNANSGVSSALPWKTFAYALDPSRASCGDTLILLDSTDYRLATTGLISLIGRVCPDNNRLVIRAANQRQAMFTDDGLHTIIHIAQSAGIEVDGVYLRGADINSGATNVGRLFYSYQSQFITIKNSVLANPNRFKNLGVISFEENQDGLAEGNEAYTFGRHCVSAGKSYRITVRQMYCNPRGFGSIGGGKIPGAFGLTNGSGSDPDSGDAIMTMYPCQDCTLENSIADCTTHHMFMNEMNADYNASVPMTGAQVLGSFTYNCFGGVNGVYPNGRKVADANHSPTGFLIQDVAFIDNHAEGSAIKCSDCVNGTINRVTIRSLPTISDDPQGNGAIFQDTTYGLSGAQLTGQIRNSVSTGNTSYGFLQSAGAWTGASLRSGGNGINYSPALPGPWGASSQVFTPNYGNCKGLWVPDGSPLKGAGTGGSDIGANILYQYRNRVLNDGTNGQPKIPLWSPETGAFPNGRETPDGWNRVAGNSLFDLHQRIKVKTGGCELPASYPTASGPSDPGTYTATTDLTGPHSLTIPPGSSIAVVSFGAYSGAQNVGTASAISDSCGNNYTALPDALGNTVWYTSPAFRSLKIFFKFAPNVGVCDVTPTVSGTVDGWAMVSTARAGVGSTSLASFSNGFSITPGVTVATNPDQNVIDFLVTSPTPGLTAGPDQLLTIDLKHTATSLRLASSEQAGALGGVMTHNLSGAAVYWVTGGLSFSPVSPDPPSTSVIEQTDYQIYYGYGSEASVQQKSNPNTAADVGLVSAARVRFKLTNTIAQSAAFGAALFCRKDADSYSRVADNFNGKVFRFFGAGVQSESAIVLASGTSLTIDKLAGAALDGGIFSRDETFVPIIPILDFPESYDVEYELAFESASEATVQCRIYKDDNTPLGLDPVYVNTATFNLKKGVAQAP